MYLFVHKHNTTQMLNCILAPSQQAHTHKQWSLPAWLWSCNKNCFPHLRLVEGIFKKLWKYCTCDQKTKLLVTCCLSVKANMFLLISGILWRQIGLHFISYLQYNMQLELYGQSVISRSLNRSVFLLKFWSLYPWCLTISTISVS